MEIFRLLTKYAAASALSLFWYEDNLLVTSYNEQPLSTELVRLQMQPYFDSPVPLGMLTTPEQIQFGMIRHRNSNAFLLVGPAVPFELKSSHADLLIQRFRLPRKQQSGIYSWFYHIPVMDAPAFKCQLDMLNFLLNGTEDAITPLAFQDKRYNIKIQSEDISYYDVAVYEFENRLIPLIRQGRTEEVILLMRKEDAVGHAASLGPTTIRTMKNYFISSTALISRIAIDEGLLPTVSLSLSDYYIARAEKLDNYAQIQELLYTMMTDYCGRIARVHELPSSSATVSAIVRLIDANIYEPLSTASIAETLHMSASYISHHFKKQTNKSLSQYISEQKISEGRLLLKANDLSISDIAERLNFSSQQYFQAQFKKFTGVTPQEYRRSTAAALK